MWYLEYPQKRSNIFAPSLAHLWCLSVWTLLIPFSFLLLSSSMTFLLLETWTSRHLFLATNFGHFETWRCLSQNLKNYHFFRCQHSIFFLPLLIPECDTRIKSHASIGRVCFCMLISSNIWANTFPLTIAIIGIRILHASTSIAMVMMAVKIWSTCIWKFPTSYSVV